MDIKEKETHTKETEITGCPSSTGLEDEQNVGEEKSNIRKALMCFIKFILITLAFVIVTAAAIFLYKWTLSMFSNTRVEEKTESVTIHSQKCKSDTTTYNCTKTTTFNIDK